MMLPSDLLSPLRVALATVPEEIDWSALQACFPERPLDQLSPTRRLEHAAVAAAMAELSIGEVRHDPSGRPLCAEHSISISHATDEAGQLWAAVVSGPIGTPLGIDLERPRPQLARVAPRIFSQSERELIAGRPALQSVVWNIKEAGWKAFGPNLDYRADIETLEVCHANSMNEGAIASVRIRKFIHRYYVASLPHDLSMAVGPLPQG